MKAALRFKKIKQQDCFMLGFVNLCPIAVYLMLSQLGLCQHKNHAMVGRSFMLHLSVFIHTYIAELVAKSYS